MLWHCSQDNTHVKLTSVVVNWADNKGLNIDAEMELDKTNKSVSENGLIRLKVRF